MPYRDDINVRLYADAWPPAEPCVADPHDGGWVPEYQRRISIAQAEVALDRLRRVPRHSGAALQRIEATESLNNAMARERSDLLLTLAEAALELIANRGGDAGDLADDLLASVEDRIAVLRRTLENR